MLDNASNCATMMEELVQLLRRLGIKFSEDGNHIWYVDSRFQGLHKSISTLDAYPILSTLL